MQGSREMRTTGDGRERTGRQESSQASLDVLRSHVQETRRAEERPSLTSEQRNEIEQVRGVVRPWLQYYLLEKRTIKDDPMATSIVVHINEEFDKITRNAPRQSVGLLVKMSIGRVKERDEYRNNATLLNKVNNIEEHHIKKIWSGEELREQQTRLTQIDRDIEAIQYTLDNWNASGRAYHREEKTLNKNLNDLRKGKEQFNRESIGSVLWKTLPRLKYSLHIETYPLHIVKDNEESLRLYRHS